MIKGIQIKTFKFINKQCNEIDSEVNAFSIMISDRMGIVKDIVPTISNDGNTVFITVKYIDGV